MSNPMNLSFGQLREAAAAASKSADARARAAGISVAGRVTPKVRPIVLGPKAAKPAKSTAQVARKLRA